MFDLIIKNGLVTTSESRNYRDIAVKDGKICEVAERGTLSSYSSSQVYDAKDKEVIPSLIEPHMHIKAPLGGVVDILDFDSASKCAAYGGISTFIDFTSTLPGDSLKDAVDFRKSEMQKSSLDYACHCKIVNLVTSDLTSAADLAMAEYKHTKDPEDKKKADLAQKKVDDEISRRLEEIPSIIKNEGIPTFKLFMTYRKAGVMIDDIYMLKVLKTVRDCGGRCGFHAESNAIAEYNEEKFAEEGKLGWEYFPECKPNICEYEAVSRVLYYAEMLKAPIYFFHISTKESVKLIRDAKKRGVDVIAETCSHYLMLDKSYNKGKDGILYLMSPPLRTKEDQDALWAAIKDGTLSLVSSDNCTFTRKQKEAPLIKGAEDFRKPISGVSGIEERFTLMRSAVNKGIISENEFVKLLCENPAKIFGCYPQKGCLAVGSDADITIFDPKEPSYLKKENLHYPEELEYSVFGEFSARGKVCCTIRRGEFLVKDGIYNDKATKGNFIKRAICNFQQG